MEIICWLLFAAIFIVIELITLGLTTIWFAGGAFVAAIAGALGADLIVQVVLFMVISFALILLTRPIAVKYFDSKVQKTNAEALIGQNAIAISEIDNMKEIGMVKVNGMEWTARAKEDTMIIPQGAAVRVVEIRGGKLIVEVI